VEEFASEIGARIRDLRAARGLSLSELAHRADVGKTTLSGIESGSRDNPTIGTLSSIARQLDVPLAAILPEPTLTAIGASDVFHNTAVSAVLLETLSDDDTITELYRLHIRPGRPQLSPPHPPGTVEYLTAFSGIAHVVGAENSSVLVKLLVGTHG
jgi:transcriptional regulator with XRE-family HTH domain